MLDEGARFHFAQTELDRQLKFGRTILNGIGGAHGVDPICKVLQIAPIGILASCRTRTTPQCAMRGRIYLPASALNGPGNLWSWQPCNGYTGSAIADCWSRSGIFTGRSRTELREATGSSRPASRSELINCAPRIPERFRSCVRIRKSLQTCYRRAPVWF